MSLTNNEHYNPLSDEDSISGSQEESLFTTGAKIVSKIQDLCSLFNNSCEDDMLFKLLRDRIGKSIIQILEHSNSVEQFHSYIKDLQLVSNETNGYFCVIPNEILFHIFSFMDSRTLHICCTVSREWNRLASTDELYKQLCISDQPSVQKPIIKSWKWLSRCQSIDLSKLCRNGPGTFSWVEKGDRYQGEWKSSSRHGFGIQTWKDGASFQGYWQEDKRNGFGEMKWADGQKFSGEWKNNRKEGRGIEFWADGRNYIGEYSNSNMHGLGIYNWPAGDNYMGEWKDDNMHGTGLYVWPNGSSYVGYWEYDEHNGYGRYQCPDGETYDGQWISNSRNGVGIERWPDGQEYYGTWKRNKKEGHGILIWGNGDMFLGHWKNGRREGKGYLISDGNVYLQFWHRDENEKDPLCEESLGKLLGSSDDIDLSTLQSLKSIGKRKRPLSSNQSEIYIEFTDEYSKRLRIEQ